MTVRPFERAASDRMDDSEQQKRKKRETQQTGDGRADGDTVPAAVEWMNEYHINAECRS